MGKIKANLVHSKGLHVRRIFRENVLFQGVIFLSLRFRTVCILQAVAQVQEDTFPDGLRSRIPQGTNV